MAKRTDGELASVFSEALMLHLAKGWQVVKRRAETLVRQSFNLSLRELWVLLAASSTKPVTQKQIADYLALNQNVIVLLVDRLEKNAYVQRTRNPRNRREQFVRLTTKGKSLLRTVLGEQTKFHRIILAPLSDDRIKTVLDSALSVVALEDSHKTKTAQPKAPERALRVG